MAPTSDSPAPATPDAPPPGLPDHLTPENYLDVRWRDHHIAVTGDWTWRWLFLAPTYTLWVDGNPVDRVCGPSTQPQLVAVLEDDSANTHRLCANLTSIIGYRPPCTIRLDDTDLAAGDLRVANFLNPFLMLFILGGLGLFIYLGPNVLARLFPG